MASGKKNYFRHSFNARHDYKIVNAIDKHGKEAYFHYFVILELCASMASEHFPDDNIFTIHVSTLAQELRLNRSRVNLCLTYLQDMLLLSYTYSGTSFALRLDKLSKYMGKYETKFPLNVSNKRKEKKRKENKSIPSDLKTASDVLLDEVVSDIKTSEEEICNDIAALWNEMALLNSLPKVKTPLSKDRQKKMKVAIGEFKEYSDWLRIINCVVDNDFNLGVNDRKWKANFDWLFHTTKFNYRKLWESHVE